MSIAWEYLNAIHPILIAQILHLRPDLKKDKEDPKDESIK